MPRKRVGETPDGPQAEFLVPRLEVKVMDRPGKVFGRFEFAFNERFVDDNLRRDVRQFTSLPGFHLLPHRVEVSLHAIHADRDAINQRERFRVLGQDRREHARDNVSRLVPQRWIFDKPVLQELPLSMIYFRLSRYWGKDRVCFR